jgi:chromosome segregation ATPase
MGWRKKDKDKDKEPEDQPSQPSPPVLMPGQPRVRVKKALVPVGGSAAESLDLGALLEKHRGEFEENVNWLVYQAWIKSKMTIFRRLGLSEPDIRDRLGARQISSKEEARSKGDEAFTIDFLISDIGTMEYGGLLEHEGGYTINAAIKKEKDRLTKELDVSRGENEDLKARIAELEEAEEQIEKLDRQLKEYEKKYKDIEPEKYATLLETEKELTSLKEKHGNDLGKAADKAREWERKYYEEKDRNDKLDGLLNEAKAAMRDMESDEAPEVDENLIKLRADADAKRRYNAQLEEEREKLVLERKKLEELHKVALEELHAKYGGDLDAKLKELSGREEKISNVTGLYHAALKKIEDYEADLKEYKAKLGQAGLTIDTLGKTCNKLKGTCKSLVEECRNLYSQIEDLKEEREKKEIVGRDVDG